jgi:DNA polymerase III delta prime subunit
MAQTYVIEAAQEQGIERALTYAESELSMERQSNPDIIVLRYSVCSVEHARKVVSYASQSGLSGQKLIILAAERLFHEAQNALLKVFEEPPEGTIVMLVVPSVGMLLPTLRSRLTTLPGVEETKQADLSPLATAFITATQEERAKIIKKLLDRTKSDKDSEKQLARVEAQQLVAGITLMVHTAWRKKASAEHELLLKELETFTPLLYQPAAPLKLIFEHLLLVVPKL